MILDCDLVERSIINTGTKSPFLLHKEESTIKWISERWSSGCNLVAVPPGCYPPWLAVQLKREGRYNCVGE